METILAILVKAIGSSAFGSLIGWVGGVVQRNQDLKLRQIELDYDLKKMDKEAEHMDLEIAGKERIASIETSGKVESAIAEAIAGAQKDQLKGTGVVAKISQLVRPVVTSWYVIVSSVMTGVVLYQGFTSGVKFSVVEWKAWVDFVLEWTFFQAGVVLAWWFSVRNSQIPALRR